MMTLRRRAPSGGGHLRAGGVRGSERDALGGFGPRALMVVCCAGPALIAAGTLAAIGAIIGNPWAFGAAGMLVLTAIALTTKRRRFKDAVAALGRESPPPRVNHPAHPETRGDR